MWHPSIEDPLDPVSGNREEIKSMMDSATRVPKKTRTWVLIADKIADRGITVGGILVIGAVLGMMVFLIHEVVPLFQGGTLVSKHFYEIPARSKPSIGVAIDEYKTLAVSIDQAGNVTAWHVESGLPLEGGSLDLKDKKVTAFARTLDSSNMALGFSDGTVGFGRVEFRAEVIPEDQTPKELRKINQFDQTDGSAVYSRIPGKQVRKISFKVVLDEEIQVSDSGSPIKTMDYRVALFGERPKKILLTSDSNGVATVSMTETKMNMFTRKTTTKVSKAALPPLPNGTDVTFALVTEMADQAYFADKKGKIYRYNIRDFDHPFLAETVETMPEGTDLTVLGFLMGEASIVVGGSDGSLVIYFLLARQDAKAKDGSTLVRTREFERHASAVTGFSPGQRGKTFATGDAKGEIWIRHGTSQQTLLKMSSPKEKSAWGTILLAPRMNGLLAVSLNGTTGFWDVSIPHPEISLHTLFGKVWYEGYSEPGYTWQSTGATDAFEPKLSLVPLIFGTFKATLYSLMFAIPIALLGAIYTSEFLPSRLRGKIKPVMEVMASIPSVVLGFVAGLVLAPVVENWISAVLLTFYAVPLILMVSAYFWQLLPPSMAVGLEGSPKLILMTLLVMLGMYLAYLAGPYFEDLFFGGNFKAWLNGEGSPVGFLFLMIVPIAAVILAWVFSSLWGYRFNQYIRGKEMPYAALMDMARWFCLLGIASFSAFIIAVILTKMGFEPRGSAIGTYVQRNTFVVGFAMGFAVIPIIYTLAEDALNSVPEHLRSASLGCGATPWQTAIWIILPTALSGVFSAAMIGMGRAVGETMIVVMSAGNTPLLDLNIFNGLRALSANIAVELPEAPKDDTLYRVLFLTGLVLFGMTFVINTVAELVRLRFRKRATQL
jgi:phosphate transport system permease protein